MSLSLDTCGTGTVIARNVSNSDDTSRVSSIDSFPNSLIDIPRTPVVLDPSVWIFGYFNIVA